MSDPANIRLEPTLGGGALWDAGCYPVSLVRMVAGELPIRVHAAAKWASSGLDTAVIAMFEFKSGLLAQVSCSFGTTMHRHALIAGDNGVIETSYWNDPPLDRPATLKIKCLAPCDASQETEYVEAAALNGFRAEAESFSELVWRGPAQWHGPTHEESLDIVRMLEGIKRSAASGASVRLREQADSR